jgi:hypothetical protein
VVFVVDTRPPGKAALEESAQVVVGFVAGDEPVAREDAACVGVDDEDRPLAGVEENRVCGFRADAGPAQEPRAKLRRRDSTQPGEVAAALQPEEKGAEPSRLGVVEPGRAYERRNLTGRERGQPVEREQVAAS